MANPIGQAGATVEPSEYAALAMDEHLTGIWTQRNPLRDADVPYLYRKGYQASRWDAIIDGINREISADLTCKRRCGSSRYNSLTFPALKSYASFKWLQDGVQQLRVIADGADGAIYDATAGQKSTLFTKSAGAGPARFLSVGPTLYFGDGVDAQQMVRSSIGWKASTAFDGGRFIVDTNQNVQVCVGAKTATIVGIQVVSAFSGISSGFRVTLYFDPATSPVDIGVGSQVTLAGLTTVSYYNGYTATLDQINSSSQVSFFDPVLPGPPLTAFSAETGTASTGTGITGATQPTWSTTLGHVTIDGGAQWQCRGASIRPWGYPAPTVAPLVTQAAAPSLYPPWEASTWYGSALIIKDGAGYTQQLTQTGTTGSSAPTFSPTPGTVTTDGTAAWTNRGSADWQATTAYAVNAMIVVHVTYTIHKQVHLDYYPYHQDETVVVTVDVAYICQTAGTSGANPPAWTNGVGTTVKDGTVTWRAMGDPLTWATIGASTKVSTATQVIDSNANVETASAPGKTGSTAPTWPANSETGKVTLDGNQQWVNSGPYAAASTGAWIYSYSGKDTVTKDVTTESPVSVPITQAAGKTVVIQGQGLDARMDSIMLWRTSQGKATRVYLDEIPNPGPTAQWIYTDTTPDTPSNGSPGLNALIEAPTDNTNDPAPAALTAPEYHCGRVWGIDGFSVRYSGGPDTLVGNGNNTFPPNNYYLLPEQPMRLKSIPITGGGLLVICQVNTYIIMGNGTSVSPFVVPRKFMEWMGVGSYDAACVVGATLYAYTTTKKLVRFDPANGYEEIGFPIGDQLELVTTGGIATALYDPASTYLTWHETSSGETALYVSDGSVGWFRWSPIAPPETGSLWSPRAAIVGGTSAVQSIETSPGKFQLLIGPQSSGPILYRDRTVYGDWNAGDYQGYPSWDVKGSIALCETGEVAELAHVALQSLAVGNRPIVSLLLDEIQAGVTVDGQTTAWDVLTLDERHEEPPNLSPSLTLYSDRYKTSSTATTPKCMHFQLKVDYGTQQVGDELLKFAIFGAVFKERKQQ